MWKQCQNVDRAQIHATSLKILHQVGFEPALQEAAILKRHALTIAPSLFLNIFYSKDTTKAPFDAFVWITFRISLQHLHFISGYVSNM